MIELRGLSKSYDGGAVFAVKDVSLTVKDGKTLVLLGSSGSGKTTVLKMINRLIEPTSGSISVDGRDVMSQELVALRRSIGYVFQRVGLFPHMTVEENVAVGLRLLGRPEGERLRRARELLELVELPPDLYARRFPSELSGGQAQRVGVARALATDPAYLLMDEPFGALDEVTRVTLRAALKGLRARLGKTIIFVTHDIFEALDLGDEIGVMHKGALEQLGSGAELIRSPATVLRMIGSRAYSVSAISAGGTPIERTRPSSGRAGSAASSTIRKASIARLGTVCSTPAVPRTNPSRRGRRRASTPSGRPRRQASATDSAVRPTCSPSLSHSSARCATRNSVMRAGVRPACGRAARRTASRGFGSGPRRSPTAPAFPYA